MHPILRKFTAPYLQAHDLAPHLADYAKPRDFIARLVAQGELIRLKNGFFLIAEKIAGGPIPYEQIANLLYGPSYVSFEWALSSYGMIPEGVYVITSASVNKTRTFTTLLGTFDFFYLSHERYAIGLTQKENATGKYLIATPEKALVDLIHRKAKKLTPDELLIDLMEARRIEKADLKNLDMAHLREIAESYHSKTIHSLVTALGKL